MKQGQMEIIKTKLDKLVVIKTPLSQSDNRGIIREVYRTEWLENLGINVKFVQDTFNISNRGSLRGIHYDETT